MLDEPSIGLHPRDLHRINGIIRRVTEAGNTVIAIEHDPQVLLASNRMVELGPGAGKEGGAIEFDGETRAALRPENSTLTTDYLTGRRRIERAEKRSWTPEDGGWTIEGASEHNLKNLTVTIPRNRFVAVAGVSGSGKSTLINDVFYRAVRRALAQDDGEPGHFGALKGDLPAEIHLIDQSPIQRNLRSTPVSFIGAYDEIRKLFAASPEAKAAGLTPGDFSFNTGSGRCPACAGTGVEVVEMQFLSDVQIPCSICAGKRFTPRVLAVGITIGDRRYTIDDILHATVREAIDLFGEDSRIGRALAPLVELGLEYLELGQPISTLSPGEGQRLKLAEFIQNEISPKKTRSRRTKTVQKVFLFDEPSSGLHFEDVRHLVALFDRLVRNGHTVVTIEHNLDVIASADWVIELGPDGGAEGGELLYEGTPEALAATRATATGEALAAWRDARTPEGSKAFFNLPEPKAAESDPLEKHAIVVRGARENNLKNITAVIPRDRFTVLSGPSGSGKSTLAFRIVFAEGQRRYIDNLSAYARSRIQPPPIPDYDSIRGIPPTVSIEQRTSRGGWRSTAATMTEIYHYARLLFARLGEKKVGRGYVRLHDADPRLFSYNTKLGACPKCLGYGFVSQSVEKAKRKTLSIITDTQTAHFVLLPQDEDPDSLIKSQGPEAFEAQLRSAFPLSKFFVMDIVREVSQGQGLRTAEERAQAVAIAKPLLQRMTAHALRQLLVQEFAAAVRMEPAEVASLCGVTLLDVPQTKPAKALSGYGRDTKQGERSKRPVRPVTTGPVFTNIKRRLLQCFVTHPSWLIKYSDQIEYEMLDTVDEWEEAIVRLWHLAQDHSKGEGFEESKLTTGYLLSFMQGDPLYNRLADLASEEEVLQTPEAVAEFEIKCAFLKLEKAQLDAQIAELLSMEERGEPVESQYLERLFKRRQDIHRSLIDESSQAVDFVLDSRLSG